jgi:hypothetical protein
MPENKAKTAFAAECSRAKLTDEDQDWLWNYLKNYDEELARASDRRWFSSATGAYW